MCGHHRKSVEPSTGSTVASGAAATIVTARADDRVTDQERERVVEQLRLHVGLGRLTLDEFEERVDETLEARTGAELAPVLRELPRVRPRTEVATAERALLLPFLLVMAGLVTIWAVTGFDFPWPIFPLVFWGLPTLGEWRRLRAERTAVAA